MRALLQTLLLRLIGVDVRDVADGFVLRGTFSQDPYAECLLDVAGGMPKAVALRSHNLDGSHEFLVDELDFYHEILCAERHSIKKLLELIHLTAGTKSAAQTFIWMLETIYKDDSRLSEKIKKMVHDNVAKKKAEHVSNFVNSLDVDHAKNSDDTFYERIGAN